MKITNIKNGSFYISRAAYNWNTVIIQDVGEYGCLKVLANAEKYFNTYYPEFWRIEGSKVKKITDSTLKTFFKLALENDPKYFTKTEKEKLGKYFKVKVDQYLAESKTCRTVKSYKKKTGKKVNSYARKR